MKKFGVTRRALVSLALAACLAGGQGCAHFDPEHQEPSEAMEGMRPPPEGYIFGGAIVESLHGLNH
jgi:hypothetical protein